MGRKKETGVKVKIMDWLAGEPQCWFLKTQQVTTVGIPDLLICWRGYFIAIEIKTSDKQSKPDESQLINLAEINAAGGTGVLIDDSDWCAVLNALQEMVCGKGKRQGRRRKPTQG